MASANARPGPARHVVERSVTDARTGGSMLDMFALRARRHGMVNRVVSLPRHPASDDDVVGLYESAITPRTRLLMVCHMVNITGHILPVAKICDMAHSRGVASRRFADLQRSQRGR
jgi:kynureninase